MATVDEPTIKHMFVTTVTVEEIPTTTIVVLFDNNDVAYTGFGDPIKAPGSPQWHYLPPIPSREEAEKDEEGED